MAALLFYVSRDTEVYHTLVSEIRDTFEAVEEIKLGKKLSDCRYLRACIDESLRMSPPISTSSWRDVGAGGEYVDGQFIPEGCFVGTAIYSIHHSEEYFSEPHRYKPSQWILEDGSSEDEKAQFERSRSVFHPFSLGQRSCIGKPLAYAELQLTLAVLLWKYNFQLCPGKNGNAGAGKLREGKELVGRTNPEEFQLFDRLVSIVEGPWIQFQSRT
jgi:cytochrome P450